MSDIYRCENCMFSAEIEITLPEQAEFGNMFCRRYPPQPVLVEGIGLVKSALIPTNHNWWCGEWKSKGSK